MSKIDGFGETGNVAVTVLVDNTADLLVKSTETVVRFREEPLLAEHGFAAVIDLPDGPTRVLWDAGFTDFALPANMLRMEIDPATVDLIALSHGHSDHTGAMTHLITDMGCNPHGREWDTDATMDEILEWVKGNPVSLIAHPAAFRERWNIDDEGKKYGPHTPAPRRQWEAAGAEIILSTGPYRLGAGCWTTGEVPRLSFESAGRSGGRFYRQDDVFLRDNLEDDQAIVINVRRKGLVVVAGCAHAGIVNTVNYAREISGVDRVWAIMGGFHLAPADDDEIQRTINEISRMRPAMVSPTHCTGLRAVSEFARQMPEAFVQGVVGSTYLF